MSINIAEARQGLKSATARMVLNACCIECCWANCICNCCKTSTPKHSTWIMAEEHAAHHLLNVVEERGLDIDLDKILLGFEDAKTKHQSAAWVEEYLHEDTLLTKEELEL
jgi:hypothetical protein